MRSRSIALQHLPRRRLAAIIGFTTCALFIAAHARLSRAEAVTVETFASPEQAAKALYVAVRDNEQDALIRILHIDKEAVSSADSARDRIDREQFARKYREMHRLAREPDGSEWLHVGAENWPFPFPLVAVDGGWRFDAETGATEGLLRRIGENEIAAIATCRALVTQQKQSAVSSPLREKAPAGSAPTVNVGDERRAVSFHGYYFRRIESGQPSAEASVRAASDISENAGGSLLLLAYPAEYRVTGVMTFAVDRDGTLYEADLGPQTVLVAAILSELDPTLSWYAIH
ncbi:MAG TPA: DUF2950 family protein [Casimicrobiaceae bacterium]|nr:DUF2950 family protein [Casimicrobiaceae bacterium]